MERAQRKIEYNQLGSHQPDNAPNSIRLSFRSLTFDSSMTCTQQQNTTYVHIHQHQVPKINPKYIIYRSIHRSTDMHAMRATIRRRSKIEDRRLIKLSPSSKIAPKILKYIYVMCQLASFFFFFFFFHQNISTHGIQLGQLYLIKAKISQVLLCCASPVALS